MTKELYEKYLNVIGCPENDKKSNGGRIPDGCKYGAWLRKYDPISFEVGLREANR